jgi:putative ABC transport system substrate-binding protein
MRRRELMLLLGGAVIVWPLAGHAQQPERLRRLGVLMLFREHDPNTQPFVMAFAQALERFGWVEGKNIRIDYRFATGDRTLYKTYAAELIGLAPDAILANRSPAVRTLRQQTRTVPIVFVDVSDPAGQGFIQSLARPGGNITGFSMPDAPIYGKWLQLLKEIAPGITRVAVIFNPDNHPIAALNSRAIEDAAPSLGITVTLAPVHDYPGSRKPSPPPRVTVCP